jgi:hypothetical protein
MEEIKARFGKGDTVFAADTSYAENWIGCPDCLGTLKWTVVFADGEAVEVECQTCKRGWNPPSGKVNITAWKPTVNKLTVGSVRYNDTDKQPFSYMCVETGVGSGRVYHDEDLFTDVDAAQVKAQEKYEAQMQHIAQNNFSKRLGGTKELEGALSSWGFGRKLQLEKAQEFRRWAKISKIIK